MHCKSEFRVLHAKSFYFVIKVSTFNDDSQDFQFFKLHENEIIPLQYLSFLVGMFSIDLIAVVVQRPFSTFLLAFSPFLAVHKYQYVCFQIYPVVSQYTGSQLGHLFSQLVYPSMPCTNYIQHIKYFSALMGFAILPPMLLLHSGS